MSRKLSRRVISKYAADQILAGNTKVIDEIAALLISERREREAVLLVRDIEEQMAERGELVVTVESAHPVNSETKKQVTQLFPGKTVHIREVVRPELIGGCRITTPSQQLDASIAKQLTDLRAMKV